MLTRRRVGEILGVEPPEDWWRQRSETWRAAGFAITVDAERGWMTATLIAAPAAETLDVRVVADWLDPQGARPGPGVVRRGQHVEQVEEVRGCAAGALVATTAVLTVGGAESTVDLADADVCGLVLAAARLERRADGGGSGI